MRFTSVNYYSSIVFCSWCFIGVHQDWHDVPCWSASNADRGFPRAVSEPVLSVSELDRYTSCMLSVTDTCLYRNNRVISPGDFDILYKWLCILVSSWNPANTSWRWYQMRKAKDWNWDLNKSFSNIPRKMFFNSFLDAHKIHHFKFYSYNSIHDDPSYHYPTKFWK